MRVAVLTALVPLVACEAVAGLDDFQAPLGAGGQGGASTGGGGGLPPCDGGVCVPHAPAGWSGPGCVQLYDDVGGSCDPAFRNEVAFGGVGTPEGPVCTPCQCGPATGGTCAFPLAVYPDAQCSGNSGQPIMLSGSCTSVGATPSVEPLPATVEGGSCAPSGGSERDLPPFQQIARLCEVAGAVASCGEGECQPAVAGCSHCIWREGELTCPPGAFEGDPVVVGEFVDLRGCDACVCGSPQGGSCEGWEVRGYDAPSCQPLNHVASAFVGGCADAAPSFITHALVAVGGSVTTEGSCVPAGGAFGDVTITKTWTVCCAG
jgi:hypothetical protein